MRARVSALHDAQERRTVHRAWRLVRSVRIGRRVVQQTVAHLGDLSEGTHLLRSNVTDWSDEKLWRAYIHLTQAEAAFRIQKDQLAIRPIWHQRADRMQAHILVCFLAFVLWKTLELWQARAGLGNSLRTLLEELARIQAPTLNLGKIQPTHLSITPLHARPLAPERCSPR